MFKALLRKQMYEIRNSYLNGKRNKNKKKTVSKKRNPVGMYIFLGFLYLIILGSFFALDSLFAITALPLGLDWMYFTLVMALGFLMGIIGSVFSTISAIYKAKDNELLLSLPIPPYQIVAARMISVYIMGFIYEAAVMLPGILAYIIFGTPTFAGILLSVLSTFVLGFLILAVSCGISWIVSLISTKLKNQKIVSVIFIAILILFFMYIRFAMEGFFRDVAENMQSFADSVENSFYLVYAGGKGMAGDFVGFLVFLGVSAVLFALAYYLVSKSFAKITLTKSAEKKVKFKITDIKASNVSDTLFRKELGKFLSSVSYMLNGGMGIILLVAGAVIAFIKMEDIKTLAIMVSVDLPEFARLIPVGITMLICVVSSFVLITASSISLEGKNIWVYQTLPVDPYQVFKAKIMVHVVLTGIPALLCLLALGLGAGFGIVMFILTLVLLMMYIVFVASAELMVDVKRPKLDWTNENQVLKSSGIVMLDMLAGLILPIVVIAIYYFVSPFILPELYIVIFIAAFAGGTLLVHRWLAGKGREIFPYL